MVCKVQVYQNPEYSHAGMVSNPILFYDKGF